MHEDEHGLEGRGGDARSAQQLDARAVVCAVPDPELPYVTLGDLGVVAAVHEDGYTRSVRVELTPTYLGCPATEVIQRDVENALLDAGWRSVAVVLRFDPPWTPERISATGRAKLAAEGVAPPPRMRPAGHTPVPVFVELGGVRAEVPCPRCGAAQTERLSAFGPAPCQELRRCTACLEPFPAIKSSPVRLR
ncbi:phenylacetate-CoA oxygenase subunit PaaJ [Actinocrinis puniceicyclus]|uniref:Phenylacetate-CoA oxygenase subunit PaaJ n=1 Tax=Actinocrinis puniceicyclus TaxID=977794 RepID=A0A8J8BDA1_9ACTN|nr:1,2-phenylacetyl-CoA epoxidase subunit PaaD [Actinocrinis puniceicyclus]MBS2963876.1 phenylacetate-CoA oxygenase subunit PaaJ [Actinocrinis puniceicyclus]